MIIDGKNWRKAHGSKTTFTLPLEERNGANANTIKRVSWDSSNNIFNIWYPTYSESEIDVHRSRLQISKDLKYLLCPKKYFTYIQRDNKFNGKYGYTVDYYAEIDSPPDNLTIKRICDICDSPVLI